jgi:acetyl esterase/lipase
MAVGIHALPGREQLRQASHCRVNAGGVPAEWVEATLASTDQQTLVYFVDGVDPAACVERIRGVAQDLAVETGARVLTIGCRRGPEHPHPTAIEDGVAAYTWLLQEGCNLKRTAFVQDSTNTDLVAAILRAARRPSAGYPLARSIRRRGSHARSHAG